MNRKPYPSDISNEEWAFVAPYLTLMSEDAPQREHSLREVFNALRWIVRTGAPWRFLPRELPPWEAGYQQSQRWIKAGVFEAMVSDLREILRLTAGRAAKPSAVMPRRWVVDGSFGWAARFRRLARDYERLPEALAGLHFLAFAILMLKRFVEVMT